jgi:hypothetical protein
MWIWYHTAREIAENGSALDYLKGFWAVWNEVCLDTPFVAVTKKMDWDDPVFYVLEGLESLLSVANRQIYGLTPEENSERIGAISRLASIATTMEFFNLFLVKTEESPSGWSEGASRLKRMFFQRIICMRWKAEQLAHHADKRPSSLQDILHTESETLKVSLRRALITDAETSLTSVSIFTAMGQSSSQLNPLREAFHWLHEAIVSFARFTTSLSGEPLHDIEGNLHRLHGSMEDSGNIAFFVDSDRFIPILYELTAHSETEETVDETERGDVRMLALETFAAIVPREQLISLLSKRRHLLQATGEALPAPLPPLPGLPANGLLFVSPKSGGEKDCAIEIEHIWWLSVPDLEQASALPPKFRMASSGHSAQDIELQWVNVSTSSHLRMQKAKWDVPGAPHMMFQRPPTFPASSQSLAWAANIFESLARLNYPEGPSEFVAAWPYLVVSELPSDEPTAALKVSLITLAVSKVAVDGQAFIRDGERGLQSYEVHEQYGRFWRAGVMITDLFGMRRALDRYASLFTRDGGGGQLEDDLEPAAHLFRNVLLKWRGSHFDGRVLKFHANYEHIPATLARSLRLLREFKGGEDSQVGIRYVLSSEAESSAMQIRLGSEVSLDSPGVGAAFAERIAVTVTNRLPIAWSQYLMAGSIDQDSIPTRIIPKTWFDLSGRITALKNSNENSSNADRGFLVFVAGLRIAALSTWLRSLALEIEAFNEPLFWPLPEDGELSYAWCAEERGGLFGEPAATIGALSEKFRSELTSASSQRNYSSITPLGWLILVLGRVGIYGKTTQRKLQIQWQPEHISQCKAMFKFLSLTTRNVPLEEGVLDVEWPFEFSDHSAIDEWVSPKSIEFFRLLAVIEKNIGITVESRLRGAWGLNPAEHTFTDNELQTWELKPWQVWITGGSKPERVKIKRKFLSIWDETRDDEDGLLMLTARSDRVAKLLPVEGNGDPSDRESPNNIDKNLVDGSVPDIRLEGAQPEPVNDDDLEKPKVFHPSALESDSFSSDTLTVVADQENSSEPPVPISDFSKSALNIDANEDVSFDANNETQDPISLAEEHSVNSEKNSLNELDKKSIHHKWKEMQRKIWSRRESKSPGHIRVALMQWDVAETYHHPVIDADSWMGDWPPQGDFSAFEVSAIEARRRELLVEALSACATLRVQLLVLPEYSVRPETVGWLRTQLKRKDMPSVLAGTYKIHGNVTDVGFEKTYSEILGASDFGKIFGNHGYPSSSVATPSSGEHSAMLTLLTPVNLDGGVGGRMVCTFSRRKKYPSLAAGEVINPLIEEIRPLYSPEALLSELESRTVLGERKNLKGMSVSATSILSYAVQKEELQYLAEFVCSELFLPMSPVNHAGLASELQKMSMRFGAQFSDIEASKSVVADLKNISLYLGTGAQKSVHRTLLLVPAMTSRSADYWIFGQAALLAGGATTVFCNAVTKDSVGGSCFIGRNSWNPEAAKIHCDLNTPYSGWSKGIYYGVAKDTLGRKEKALVVADIDPMFMHEGKPRPQALAVPLQLVGYFPIVEVKGDFASTFAGKMASTVDKVCRLPSSSIVSPSELSSAALCNAVKEVLEETDEGGFSERIRHWEKYWRANPSAGVPPAIVDWLWVDTTVNPRKSATVFIPNWGGLS